MMREHCRMAEIVPSEELRALIPAIYRMFESRDVDGFDKMLSTSPSLLVVGSDAAEWNAGTAGANIFLAQIEEMPRFRVVASAPSAYRCGDVGWVADRLQLRFGDGTERQYRLTAMLVVERGHWHIVQWHLSLPEPNLHPLTTDVEQLARVVRDHRPDMSPAAAPDGTVTIAFSDIESSTVLLERLGDADFVQMLAWHDHLVRESTETHRGFVVKSQGDGFMLAFPSAAYALRASLSLRDRLAAGFHELPIRVRVGLHVGEALRHSDDFYGRTVVVAARIGALALGGEILASDLVYALTRGLGTFTFGEARSTKLKGLDGTFDLYPVIA
jgi:class 3 adenylate cyclase